MFRSGAFVAEQFDGLCDDQRQHNGIDLTVDGIAEPAEPGRIGREDKTVAERRPVEPAADGEAHHLSPGGYVVTYGERIAVPEGHLGLVLPRSSLLRNGCTLETAVWDTGYEGVGEGLLQVAHEIEIEPGARIGQFVLAEADHAGTYAGDYQGEGGED